MNRITFINGSMARKKTISTTKSCLDVQSVLFHFLLLRISGYYKYYECFHILTIRIVLNVLSILKIVSSCNTLRIHRNFADITIFTTILFKHCLVILRC